MNTATFKKICKQLMPGPYEALWRMKESAKKTGTPKKEFSKVVIEDSWIAEEQLFLKGFIAVPESETPQETEWYLSSDDHSYSVTCADEENKEKENDFNRSFSFGVPLPEEMRVFKFEGKAADGSLIVPALEYTDKKAGKTSEGDRCAWGTNKEIICDPNIGDDKQAAAVYKLRTALGSGEGPASALRIPADQTRSFEMMTANAEQLLRYIETTSGDPSAVPRDVQLGVLGYLNAAFKSALDFGEEYTWDDTDYSANWEKLHQLMTCIDDDLIMDLKKASRYMKAFFMQLKCPEGCRYVKDGTNMCMQYGDTEMYDLISFETLIFHVKPADGRVMIEGAFHLPAGIDFEKLQPVALINDTVLHLEVIPDMADRCRLDRIYLKETGFRLDIPAPSEYTMIRFGYYLENELIIPNRYVYQDLTCSVSNDSTFGYMYEEGLLFDGLDDMVICRPCAESELKIREELLRQEVMNHDLLALATRHETILIRDFYRLWRFGYDEEIYRDMKSRLDAISAPLPDPEDPEKMVTRDDLEAVREIIDAYIPADAPERGRSVWLIMDRPDRADDNGEAFFRYMAEKKPENINTYFLLKSVAAGAEELGSLGRVVEPLSLSHCLLHVIADFVISSQMQEFVMNPFNERQMFLHDLCKKPEVIFLQHGVINNHHGKVMGRYGRGFRGFITSGCGEYEYIKSDFFHYTENEVWLTGLPRFDRLYDDDKKIITIMPTWRKWLTHRGFDPEINSLSWIVNDGFEDSAYYQFYAGLLNDERLLNAAEKYGYQIAMLPHVNFLKLSRKFPHSDQVKIHDYEEQYRKVYAESSLIVTDYTSAVFDFAYLHKPIVYCQFDKDEFYTRHTVKRGYFDFERDGFGEVTYNKDDCVDVVIDYMENSCKLKDFYRDRIDRFFSHIDHNCCERLFERLMEIEANR